MAITASFNRINAWRFNAHFRRFCCTRSSTCSHRGSWIFSDSIIEYDDCSDYMVSPQGWAEMFERNRIVLRAAHEASALAVTA
jgi:hypothetical protein